MRRFFTLILLCSFYCACKPGIPKDIIQPTEMEKVLYDIHVVDGYVSSLSLPNPDSSKKIVSPLYKGVYNKHGIDSVIYNKSLDYYYKHPQLMKVMYEQVTAKLSKAKDKAGLPTIDQGAKPIETAKLNNAPKAEAVAVKAHPGAITAQPVAAEVKTTKVGKSKAGKGKPLVRKLTIIKRTIIKRTIVKRSEV